MKKIFATALLIGAFGISSSQTISFIETTLDYGNIKPNADGNKTFIVKNIGDKPLIISNVKPSCGCTSPDWSKDPILPGKTGQIKIHYNTAIQGAFRKSIEVFSNDPKSKRSVIYIKGNVTDATEKNSTKP